MGRFVGSFCVFSLVLGIAAAVHSKPAPTVVAGVLPSNPPVVNCSPCGRTEFTWRWENAVLGHPVEVVVSVPPRQNGQAKFPVLVALHGRGESKKGAHRGARGWLDDYQLSKALDRLGSLPLTRTDFQGFVRSRRLGLVNRGLRERPYAGLILVFPYLPNIMKGEDAFAETPAVAEFIVDTVLPAVRRATPVLGTASSTGIDGVSLGARAAWLVGLSRPGAFGAVGGLQLAIDRKEVPRLVEMAKVARVRNPALQIRLLTSSKDYYLRVNKRLSGALKRAGVAHDFRSALGTHSYRFNRGPGAYGLLLYHDRVLRGLSSN